MSMLSNNRTTSVAAPVEESPAGRRSRVERNKHRKRARILRAARRLFGRKGFERTTTREIAEAADVGAGTLFLYAGTKEDLLVSVFREEIDHVVRDAFATVPAGPLLDRVLHVFGALLVHHERDRGLARVFVKELPFVEDRRHGVAETMADLLGGIARLIEEAQAVGEIDPGVSSSQLASNLFALYFARLQRRLGGGDVSGARQRDEGLRATLDLQLTGLRAAAEADRRRDPSFGVFRSEHAGRIRGGRR